MTTPTNDTDRTVQLVGQLLSAFIDVVEDDQVLSSTKAYLHDVLDNGWGIEADSTTFTTRRVWELVRLLGFTETSDPFAIEQAIHPLLDSYDLFN